MRLMQLYRATAALTVLLACRAAPLAAQERFDAQESAAREWLALVDAGEFGIALDSAAPLLRRIAGTADQWARFIGMARGDRGAVESRSLLLAQRTASIPGAPPGDYVRLAFQVQLARGSITETVVLVEVDGTWRVAMYGVSGG